MITPLAEITGKQWFRPYRKVFWVLAFFVAMAHGWVYFQQEYAYNGTLLTSESLTAWDVVSWMVAWLVMTILGVTSLNLLHAKLGKYWKTIHQFVFPLFLIAALHVAFASRFDTKYMALITLVVFIRIVAFIKTQEKGKSTTSSTNGKYLCVPCGYIYDPAIWDPDSGIPAGTSFEAIPDSWRCPVCGVSKADFIPYEEKGVAASMNSSQKALVEQVNFLNPTTVEFTLKIQETIKSIPGQFAKIILTDKDGEFSRSYSIVKQIENSLTFCVKLGGGRGARILSGLKVGQELGFWGVFGDFILKETPYTKVFIATGTGIAPIMNMMRNMKDGIEKHLYFGVSKQEDTFYRKDISEISWVHANFYLSQEEAEWYIHGRVDVTSFTFPKETEFYLCGNPNMVQSATEWLEKLGYTSIFSEKFN